MTVLPPHQKAFGGDPLYFHSAQELQGFAVKRGPKLDWDMDNGAF
jgi:hypothetical protein